MSYAGHPEKIIRVDSTEDWAGSCIYMADALIRTAQLALENTDGGACSDVMRVSSAANTLEVALAMLAVAIDGTETLQRDAGVGVWGKSPDK